MITTAATGVTVGKFNPPHLGHLHLIDTAAAQVGHLYVILCDRPDQTIAASRRAAWLTAAAPPNVTVLVTPDDLPEASKPWARRALAVLPTPPDVAFTSEPWGPGWAAAMGATHVSVDVGRAAHPVSARHIRADLRAGFDRLIPPARAALAKRVAVVGAESTGKTTLARAVAESYRTVRVPEYGRWYWEGRSPLVDNTWTTDEFRRIAATHHRIADDLAPKASSALVVLDTDALVTAVWRRRYLGGDDPALLAIAEANRPDMYLVCCPDFDWVQDGTRESAGHRAAMHEWTLELVEASGVPHRLLDGGPDGRLADAVDAVDRLTDIDPLI